MKHRLVIVLIVTALLGGAALTEVHAQDSIVEQIGCDITEIKNGVIGVNKDCQINDFINLFIYLSKWGMSILAFLATLMLVYGGTQFITAGGRPSKVDEGKRVITGTIVGTIIALTAYIIINTVFTAITGTKLASSNPFPVIATVFGTAESRRITIQGQTINIDRTFTGSKPGGSRGGGAASPLNACRLNTSGWSHSCSAGAVQVYCADPESGFAPITEIQKKLNTKGCSCGDEDGCFGVNTISCVRRYQIANNLPPTGVVDIKTQDLIDNGPVNCGAADATVSADLPTPVLITSITSNVGCCVVKKDDVDLYCVDGVSTGVCQSLGAGSEHRAGQCGSFTSGTFGRCGFCSDEPTPSPSTSKCFMFASPHWCTNIVAGLTFQNGKCDGRCLSCDNSLR